MAERLEGLHACSDRYRILVSNSGTGNMSITYQLIYGKEIPVLWLLSILTELSMRPKS